jgi:hypothetical protein
MILIWLFIIINNRNLVFTPAMGSFTTGTTTTSGTSL